MPVPSEPTKEEAQRALASLWSVLCRFPWVESADVGVALSGILTLLDRRSLDGAPLHANTAPVAGLGKSLLVDVAAVLATGFPAPVLSTGKTPEELQKRIDAALITGQQLVTFDNLEYPLESEALCQALSQPWYSARVLGLSKNVNVRVGTTFFTTGNNLAIVGDLTRRSIISQIDPKTERPN